MYIYIYTFICKNYFTYNGVLKTRRITRSRVTLHLRPIPLAFYTDVSELIFSLDLFPLTLRIRTRMRKLKEKFRLASSHRDVYRNVYASASETYISCARCSMNSQTWKTYPLTRRLERISFYKSYPRARTWKMFVYLPFTRNWGETRVTKIYGGMEFFGWIAERN